MYTFNSVNSDDVELKEKGQAQTKTEEQGKDFLTEIIERLSLSMNKNEEQEDEEDEDENNKNDENQKNEGFFLRGKEYLINNNNVYLVKRTKNKDGKEIVTYRELGPGVKVEAVIEKPDRKKVFEVEYAGETYITETIDLKEIENLTGKYVLDASKMKEYLNHYVDIAKRKYVVNTTGWNDDFTRFYHPGVSYENIIYNLNNQSAFTKRNPDLQHEFVKVQLQQGKVMGMLYLIATASLFIIQNTKPTLTLISGTAKTGKTLSATMVCNLFCNATDLMISANATNVALELSIARLKNLPLLVDEGALKTFDLQNLIFMISSQKGKARGTKELKVNIISLKSNVFLTSETSETDEVKRAGASRRFIQYNVSSWDDFSDQDQKLAIQMSKATGAGIDYIEHLLHNQNLQYYIDKATKEPTPVGMEEVFIPIWAGFFFLEDFYNMQFPRLGDKMMYVIEEKQEEINHKTDIASQFTDKFSQFITINSRNFISEVTIEQKISSEIWGKISDGDIFILTSIFDRFCNENGFNKKVLFNELEKIGILQAPGGRKAKPTWILGSVCSCYHIILNPSNTK